MKLMYKQLLSIVFVSIFFIGCDDKQDEELKIGFVGGLSGKYSSLGISVRDGFMLAFDEINYRINNQKVQIIQKDDQQNKNKAKEAITYFLKNNIQLIIGNTTSSMTKVSLPLIPSDTLLVSATASSSYFTKKDDNFLRIQVDNSPKRYYSLAKTLVSNEYKDIFFIYDSKNTVYTDDYNFILEKSIIEQGGNKYTDKVDLNSKYKDILNKLKKTQSDLIVIAGNSLDSANIIQYLRMNNITTKIFVSGWAKTNNFIEHGGKAIEGVLFSEAYNENSKNKHFLAFKKKFKNKYNKQATVFSLQGYELAKILIKNLKHSTDIQTLKSRILKIKNYGGLQGDITFDKYGDVMRDFFMMEVKNSQFIIKELQ
jgi:branched-chain amino acid transport system substrate-binding protein